MNRLLAMLVGCSIAMAPLAAPASAACKRSSRVSLSDGSRLCFDGFGVTIFTEGGAAVAANFTILEGDVDAEDALKARGMGLCQAYSSRMQDFARSNLQQPVDTLLIVQKLPTPSLQIGNIKITGQRYTVVTDAGCRSLG
ncbi:MAG: hypothetical protein AAFY38_07360 [Pseudomonadota bacterium]